MFLPLFLGSCVGLCFGMHYFDFSSFVIILTRTRKLIPLLLLHFGCLVALPHGAMGWSVVYDCGIF